MMRILHIEDDEKQQERVKICLQIYKPTVIVCNFDNYDEYLSSHIIDLVILDLSKDQTADTEPGDEIRKKIWETSFCPIVIFSAHGDIYGNLPDNYFIRMISKGKGDTKQLTSVVGELMHFIEQKSNITRLLNFHISDTYKFAFPAIIKNIDSKEWGKSTDVFNRLLRRRIAASMDESVDFSPIKSWEIYLYPPIGNNILTGDVLLRSSEDKNKPDSYRIVLSPSCDLQKDSGLDRKPLSKVLVASFVPLGSFIQLEKDKSKRGQFIESLSVMLSNTYTGRYLPFPGLKDFLPHMACDFKQLEMIEYEEIGEGENYVRLLSIDSPFREAIVWAYMQNNCRPGLPDRNINLWAEQIFNDLS